MLFHFTSSFFECQTTNECSKVSSWLTTVYFFPKIWLAEKRSHYCAANQSSPRNATFSPLQTEHAQTTLKNWVCVCKYKEIECVEYYYFNSFNCTISFCNVYRTFLISTALTPSTTWKLLQLHEIPLTESSQNMSCFNYINSTNYSILFCEGNRICLVLTTLTASTTEFHVVKFNCINYIDSLNYTISFISCFNYINSINYIFSFYKDYRICLISITSTPSSTQFHFMRLAEYVLFQLH